MNIFEAINQWFENRWVAPAYSGWLLLGLAIFFFAAATNTMVGWLYVISGTMIALLAIASVLPPLVLKHLQVKRSPISPISAGNTIQVELHLVNPTPRPKTLFEVYDLLPIVLAPPQRHTVEFVPAQDSYRWVYSQPAPRRGIYRWHTVQLRTAAPLGLFWCRRTVQSPATAIVYPRDLNLSQCPLLDEIGTDTHHFIQSRQQSHGATEGLTRALRPYRWGDPTRLVHWRTSARYGELRVRELEVLTGGQAVVIGLDSAIAWDDEDCFEQAVTAATSLYFYALRQNLSVQLWTAATGLVRGDTAVLETLAGVTMQEDAQDSHIRFPNCPWIWLSQTPAHLAQLPPDSRGIIWGAIAPSHPHSCLRIQPHQLLQPQLQASASTPG
ncbi:MAG: DUF58 domain-containing protein [Synechococcales cyanobacterium T60_A2020_003]|nr:DUF58 domain-containing protein [Synechococcales cyanobacterium T60_A2020_003]